MIRTIRGATLAVAAALAAATVRPHEADAAQKPASPAAAAQPDKPASEQSIYIPYKKLRQIFEKRGRVVVLPYEQFRSLWDAAREKTARPGDAPPPVDSLITEAIHEAVVTRDVVEVKARLRIEVLKDGWNRVPLRLRDAAVTRAAIGEAPARLVFEPRKGYHLLVEKLPGKELTVDLALEYARAYDRAPGRNRVQFETPSAPVSRWRVRVPAAGVKVDIDPLLAVTQAPPGADKAETVVMAFVGAAPRVQIAWTPKAEGAKGLEALASVSVRQQVRIDEGVTRTRTQLDYTISRAELGRLVVETPLDHRVAGVFDANVREWSVKKTDKLQQITVDLFEPAAKTQSLTIELEKFGAKQAERVEAPVVRAVGVGRQHGIVVVDVAEGLRAEVVGRSGLLQLDRSELPKDLAQCRFAYRYAALPYGLSVAVEKIKPHVELEAVVAVALQPNELLLTQQAVFHVQRAGVFRFDLEIPEGYELRQVTGLKAAKAAPAQVDTRQVKGKRLTVNLSRKAIGRVGLLVQLHRTLAEPDLLSPTGKSVRVPIAAPRAAPETVARQQTALVVYAAESLRVDPQEASGLQPASVAEATASMASQARPPVRRAVAAWTGRDAPMSVVLVAERRKPHVTARQLLVARIDAGVIKYEATLFYDILYSGVRTLRVDLPKALAERVRLTTRALRYRTIDKAPDLAPETVGWEISGEAEFLGTASVGLAWEHKLEELEVGKPARVAAPRITPRAVDRAWGQIVVAKAETIDVRPAEGATGLRPIDPQHDLMPGASVKAAARAFEFHDDWALVLEITRYELQEIKRTSIESALVRAVVTRSDVTSFQAIYRVRSARQRLHIKLPEGVRFDTEPLRLNGRPVTLERSDKEKNVFSVPLVGRKADEPFLLELRYTVPAAGLTVACPVFPETPAVQKVWLMVYLPEEQVFLGAGGPWTDEQVWRWRGLGMYARPARTSGDLLTAVSSGVSVDLRTLDAFQTDGKPHLFSTLQPPDPPEGVLHLTAVRDTWLHTAIVIAIAVGGLVLLRAGARARWMALGGLAIALVLLSVFLPTTARQLAGWTLLGSIVIVLIVWLVWHKMQARPVDSGAQAPPEEPGPSEAPPEKPSSDEPKADDDEGRPSND